jgi:hypothetical protein
VWPACRARTLWNSDACAIARTQIGGDALGLADHENQRRELVAAAKWLGWKVVKTVEAAGTSALRGRTGDIWLPGITLSSALR